jgi:hypothetical protein
LEIPQGDIFGLNETIDKQLISNDFALYSQFKLQTKILTTRCKTSHLDACTFVKHPHPSYANIVVQMSSAHTLGEVRTKILCLNPTTPMVSLFPRGRANKSQNKVHSHLGVRNSSVESPNTMLVI